MYLHWNCRTSIISDETLSKLSFGKIAFQEGASHLKGFTEMHSRTSKMSNTLFCDNFLKFSYFCNTSSLGHDKMILCSANIR